MASVTLGGNRAELDGELPRVGSTAPDFVLVNGDLQNVSLADFRGKKKILSIVPSLDTRVCAASTRTFDERIAGRSDVVVLVVSADLPFAQRRFCSTADLANVIALSMMRSPQFARQYGVLITSGPFAGLAARAVLALDQNDVVRWVELVPEIGQEPDYDAAFAALEG
jgi:thiol peroxidase